MSKTFSKISAKNFDVSFSSTFFVLSRFRVFLSDGSSKTLQKTFYKRNRVEKRNVCAKNSTKNPKPTFSRFFFIKFLGVSRCGEKINDVLNLALTLVLFRTLSTLTHPPTTRGSPTFFLPAPCSCMEGGVGGSGGDNETELEPEAESRAPAPGSSSNAQLSTINYRDELAIQLVCL
jgi:hypothetical protein